MEEESLRKERMAHDVVRALKDVDVADLPWIPRGVEGFELAKVLLKVLVETQPESFANKVNVALEQRRTELLDSGIDGDSSVAMLLTYGDVWPVTKEDGDPVTFEDFPVR